MIFSEEVVLGFSAQVRHHCFMLLPLRPCTLHSISWCLLFLDKIMFGPIEDGSDEICWQNCDCAQVQ